MLFFRNSADATRCKYGAALDAIGANLSTLAAVDDSRLRELAVSMRRESRDSPADFAMRAIALASESLRRTHGMLPYECQRLAGLVLADGGLAEMATGEGKTLTAVLPAFVFALHGKGAHVATVNPYLADRDCAFAAPVLARLGLSVSLLEERTPPAVKRAAYLANVTYGVGTEFGFDYLRDQLAIQAAGGARPALFHEVMLGTARRLAETVQRGHAFAVVDEADSILIDEARSPLIISTGAPRPCTNPAPYLLADRLACEMKEDDHFSSATPGGRFVLTESGRALASSALTDEVLAGIRRLWTAYVENALHARWRMRRDVNYIVADGKVIIVDEFTGRPCPERSWRDGLHQAVEAAAGVEIQEENGSEATITRPGYFRLYGKICGMTGTAAEAVSELRSSYGLHVRVIPLNKPGRRELLPDRVFSTRDAKLGAIAKAVADCHSRKQPVLIGSRTVANSEELARCLEALRLPFRILNAKQDAEEAEIIHKAGAPGSVTIATNMAGRGADIPVPEESVRVGGLHVIGMERHESSRIDRQLIGRAARQGQPGSAQFFLSAEDDLIVRHAPALAEHLRNLANSEGEISAATAANFLRVQRKVEAQDRAARSALAEYDKWLDELKHTL